LEPGITETRGLVFSFLDKTGRPPRVRSRTARAVRLLSSSRPVDSIWGVASYVSSAPDSADTSYVVRRAGKCTPAPDHALYIHTLISALY
jgi:hypothetical protein